MTDWGELVFVSTASLCTLTLLHIGRGLFVHNMAIVACRIGVSNHLIVLLIQGTEAEGIAVVVASIIQRRPSVGLGNAIGSTICNVLLAFPIGLLSQRHPVLVFDWNAKVYASASFAFTAIFAGLAYMNLLGLTGGIFLLVAFGVYIASILSALYDNILVQPTVPGYVQEPSRGIRSPNVESRGPVGGESSKPSKPKDDRNKLHITIYPSVLQCHPTETSTLLARTPSPPPPDPKPRQPERRGMLCHLFMGLLGLLCLSISGYILSYIASRLADILSLSGTVVGMTIIAGATTLSESLISAWHGRSDDLVASVTGSNIFLLTLCLGLVFVCGDETEDMTMGSIVPFEFWTTLGCSLVMLIMVVTGGRKWMAGLLMGCYGAFIGLEFTVYGR